MSSVDVLVIGSCMTDLVAYTKRLPNVGETIHGHKFSIGFGGKGANQCAAAAKLGASTAMVAKLGNDEFGENYLKNLKDLRIDVQHVKVVENASGIAQISVDDDGNNHIIIIAGANAELCCDDVKDAEDMISAAKVVVFQFETPLETTLAALRICKNYDCKTIVNGAPGVSGLDPDFFKLSDIFCVNETEAEIITGDPVRSLFDATDCVRKLVKMGCKVAVITLGDKGVVFAPAELPIPTHIAIEAVKPVDTTGAGDAFIGALAYFLAKCKNISINEAIKRSCMVATFSVHKMGTQNSFPFRKDLPPELFKR